jgi:hypothetical protein
MKNIHVLQTDKPSRLVKNSNKSTLKLCIQTLSLDKEIGCYPQNIYITSDEEIKEGDWCLSFLNGIVDTVTDQQGVYKVKNGDYYYEDKKIILTTDQDLINDGVQAIDNDFLEWFIKNPSCEEVEVELHIGSLRWSDSKNTYKIIIPKEELINCKHCDGDGIYITADSERVECPMCEKGKTPKEELQRGITITHVGKQETLEEVAERLYPIYDRFKYDEDWVEDVTKSRQDFKKGYKLAQERMYSEEEVFNLLMELSSGTPHSIAKWFEQFKKK